MLSRLLAFVLLLWVCASAFAQELDRCAGHLVTVEPGGAVSAGSKKALLSVIRSGLPIRIGWSLDVNNDGKPELVHWADAIFVTEFEGEVFAQIAAIQRQSPLRGKARIDLGDKSQHWTGLLGTNGVLEGRFDDDQPSTSVPVRMEWCIDSRVPKADWPAEIREGKKT
jgi:hypothetical protein